MNIIDLSEEHRGLFAACLEDWSADVREAGVRRARWVERSLAKGLQAKLAIDENGAVGGMIQYLPIEQSTVQGAGLYFIPCICVERARRAAVELGDKVAYREIDTSEPAAIAKWGLSDALFVDGKAVRTGPPPSYEKIKSIIAKRLRR